MAVKKLDKSKMDIIRCETCGGVGEIEDESHPMHPKQTGDGEDETWCLDCRGFGEVYRDKNGKIHMLDDVFDTAE